MSKESWKKNPLAFAPKTKAPVTSWWIAANVQADRAAFAAKVSENETARLKMRSSNYTHDKFPGKQKHP